MFYQTRVKAVTAFGVQDEQGKTLSFVGNKFVKVGDLIWTDGQIVFGHTPIRGSTTFPISQSGIPILSDDLRGYFTLQGKFKEYKIAQDDWITNSDKKFSHGAETFNGEKIIHADIDENGNKLIVTGGVFKDSRVLESHYVNCTFDNYTFLAPDGSDIGQFWAQTPMTYEQSFGSYDYPAEKLPAKLFKNGQLISTLNLETYAKDVEARALFSAGKIMEHSYSGQLSNKARSAEQLISGYNYLYTNSAHPYWAPDLATPRPAEPFIAYTVAYLQTLSVDDDNLSGIIFAATYGYCFPYLQPQVWWYLQDYTKYGGFLTDRNYLYGWKTVPFGAACCYPINQVDTPLSFRSFGGFSADFLTLEEDKGYIVGNINSGQGYGTRTLQDLATIIHVEMLPDSESKEIQDDTLFPVGDGFFHLDKFGRLSFFDALKNKIAENIPVHDDFIHIEVEHGEYELRYSVLFFHDMPYLYCNTFTPDGKTSKAVILISAPYPTGNLTDADGNVLKKLYTSQTFAPMDGYYIKKADDSLEPLQFSPLFYKLRNGDYLFGVKDGKLFHKKKDGTLYTVTDAVKNFRLCLLKHIIMAKR